MNPTIRPVDFDDHPVAQGRYALPTFSIAELVLRTKHLIRARIPRLVVSGPPFQGKTRGAQALERRLRQAVPPAVILSVTRHMMIAAPEDRIISLLLEAAHEPLALVESIDERRARLGRKLKELAHSAGVDWVLLVVDEAHQLDTAEDEYLRDLQGELSKFDILLITVLIGQPPVLLLNQKRVSQRTVIAQIVPVPLGDEMHFHGLRSMYDMATSLAGYDQTYFPERSNWSYTRFFVPYAHAAGFVMEHHASALWRAFLEEHMSAHASWEIEVPMYHFCRAIENALLNSALHDHADFTIDRSTWQSAVADCGYGDHLKRRRQLALLE